MRDEAERKGKQDAHDSDCAIAENRLDQLFLRIVLVQASLPSLSRSRPLHSVRLSSREIPVHRCQLVKRASGKANRWLCGELAELGGETPLNLAQTETGDRGPCALSSHMGAPCCSICDNPPTFRSPFV
ncbi:DUF2384 domain-containing protein (plasmid) [Mesorhizobium huakuii]|uniref:DUF2384 domain-containing protein n=1 Tax=Mesorhizobium huakuii TaxID=28104 RepID=A0A7G6T678_9HYPH|nr:DUF2384 domain-containing protein [Mesorhizobium huakuii]